MARHVRLFIRLKLRLIRNGLRGANRVAMFVIGCIVALYVAGGGFVLLATAPGDSDPAAVAVLAFAGLTLGWLIVPLLGFGVDETLDPGRLSLLPLRRSDMMAGLLASSCIGIGSMATLIALCGAFVGYAHGWGTLLVGLAVLVEWLMCLVAARALTTGLARLLRSRRMRDVAALVVALVGATAGLLGQLTRFIRLSPHLATTLAAVLRWSPAGLAGRAVVDAKAARPGPAILEILASAATVAVLLVAWSLNLRRLMTTASVSRPTRAVRAESGVSLFPRGVGFLPRTRVGAVAAKELRIMWREPLLRSQRILTGVFAAGALVAVGVATDLRHPAIVLGSAGILWWFNVPALNQFAGDRAAYWMNVAASGEPADDLRGKNLAALILHLPTFAVVAMGTAAITGGWAYIPSAACLGVAVLGCQFGLGNVTSVRFASPLPQAATNPWGVRSGQSIGTGFVLLGAFLLSGLLLAPPAVLAGVGASHPAVLWIAGPVSVAYGVAAYAIGMHISGSWLRTHQPELLGALSPSRAA